MSESVLFGYAVMANRMILWSQCVGVTCLAQLNPCGISMGLQMMINSVSRHYLHISQLAKGEECDGWLWSLTVMRCNDLSCSCCLCIISLFNSILENSRRSWGFLRRLSTLVLTMRICLIGWAATRGKKKCTQFFMLDAMLDLKLPWPGNCNPSKIIYVD